jgi:hypothetical protein
MSRRCSCDIGIRRRRGPRRDEESRGAPQQQERYKCSSVKLPPASRGLLSICQVSRSASVISLDGNNITGSFRPFVEWVIKFAVTFSTCGTMLHRHTDTNPWIDVDNGRPSSQNEIPLQFSAALANFRTGTMVWLYEHDLIIICALVVSIHSLLHTTQYAKHGNARVPACATSRLVITEKRKVKGLI